MEKSANSDQKHSVFALTAAIAPVTHAASNETWPAVLGMAAVALVVGRWCRWGTGWAMTAQRIWNCILVSVFMNWSTNYWRPMPFLTVVPLLLLILALWAVSTPEQSQRIGCVLLWPVLILLGGVFLSGIPEIELSYLKPRGEMPKLYLLPVLLLPGMNSNREGKHRWKLAVAAVFISVVTTGVLSPLIARDVFSGVYELSRSLSFLGMAERFESLVAAAMTLGLFCSMTYLLELRGGKGTWLYGALAAGLYLAGIPVEGWFLAVGSIVAWVILPLAETGKIISKNRKKGIDKTPPSW